jgi:hypothetical protein
MVISMPRPEDMPWNKKKTGKLIPDQGKMEETIHHLPVVDVKATVNRGWWSVMVRCEPMGPWYEGKKDRSYFRALAKSLDTAMVAMGHRA